MVFRSGSIGNDTLLGGAHPLNGSAGNDSLDGGIGADTALDYGELLHINIEFST